MTIPFFKMCVSTLSVITSSLEYLQKEVRILQTINPAFNRQIDYRKVEYRENNALSPKFLFGHNCCAWQPQAQLGDGSTPKYSISKTQYDIRTTQYDIRNTISMNSHLS